MYKVIFYKTSRGEEPIAGYLKTLDIKARAKFYTGKSWTEFKKTICRSVKK